MKTTATQPNKYVGVELPTVRGIGGEFNIWPTMQKAFDLELSDLKSVQVCFGLALSQLLLSACLFLPLGMECMHALRLTCPCILKVCNLFFIS